ncbi:MAG: MBL fold metallo-hydrolase [Alphaproteobacteria bacterium]|nr:MBL fold metallo-hydrolase [Alphaproteobacteria bacterium]
MSLAKPGYAYQRGLTDLGRGTFAYLQPDGSWGWSNAGLITDGDQSLLVDTLFDLKLTRQMLDTMRDAAPKAAGRIGTLVNTHHNGDHCYGNECVHGAEIIASVHATEEMKREQPAMLAGFMKAAPGLGLMGDYFLHCFRAFDFEGITPTLPTTTFSGHLTRKVGDKTVELIEVGPAHTGGDVLVHVPAERTVFTGDILFIEGTPIMWAGPVGNWIAACDQILALDCATIVPGHGPVTDKRGVKAVQGYLAYIRDEARKRFDAGLSARDAAHDIALGDYDSWGDAERIAVNVSTLYREFANDASPANPAELFGLMAEIWQSRRR